MRMLDLSQKQLKKVKLLRQDVNKRFLIKKTEMYRAVEESSFSGSTIGTNSSISTGVVSGTQTKDIVHKLENTNMDFNIVFDGIETVKDNPIYFKKDGIYVYDYDTEIVDDMKKIYTKYRDDDTDYLVDFTVYPDMTIINVLYQGLDFKEYMMNRHDWEMYKLYATGIPVSALIYFFLLHI